MTDPSAAERRPVDAARIREVLRRYREEMLSAGCRTDETGRPILHTLDEEYRTDLAELDALLRALTSGAEAGERVLTHPLTGDAVHVSTQSGRITGVEPMPKCQHGNPVNARCPECAKSGMPSMTWEPPDRGASAERPLSEWSDDELFRRAGAGTYESWHQTQAAEILRKRGWRPHHGSGCPVTERAPVRYRDGFTGESGPNSPRWDHSRSNRNPDLDIIAYRPVPANAEPTAIAGEVERRKAAVEYAARSTIGSPGHRRIASLAAQMAIDHFQQFAALHSAPSEEQVERAAEAGRLMSHSFSGETTLQWKDVAERTRDRWRAIARAVLANAEARPGERG